MTDFAAWLSDVAVTLLYFIVMSVLVAGIHAFVVARGGVDARDKREHDVESLAAVLPCRLRVFAAMAAMTRGPA